MTSHNEDKGHWHGDIQDGKMHFELPDATSTSHNEAQKTKADWLRSKIEKLEGEKLWEYDFQGKRSMAKKNWNDALTTIITRYKKELKVLEKGV